MTDGGSRRRVDLIADADEVIDLSPYTVRAANVTDPAGNALGGAPAPDFSWVADSNAVSAVSFAVEPGAYLVRAYSWHDPVMPPANIAIQASADNGATYPKNWSGAYDASPNVSTGSRAEDLEWGDAAMLVDAYGQRRYDVEIAVRIEAGHLVAYSLSYNDLLRMVQWVGRFSLPVNRLRMIWQGSNPMPGSWVKAWRVQTP